MLGVNIKGGVYQNSFFPLFPFLNLEKLYNENVLILLIRKDVISFHSAGPKAGPSHGIDVSVCLFDCLLACPTPIFYHGGCLREAIP